MFCQIVIIAAQIFAACAQHEGAKAIILQELHKTEQQLQVLVNRTEALLELNPCPDLDCRSECSLLGCGNHTDFVCEAAQNPGQQIEECGCTPGRWRSYNRTTVSLPDGVDFSHVESQAFVCASRFLESHWKQDFPEGLWLGQMVSNLQGVTRTYPAELQLRSEDACQGFNVQLRPWFVAAVSGPKNVVLVLDASGSMLFVDFPPEHVCYGKCLTYEALDMNPDCCESHPNRLAIVRPAMSALADGFTGADNVAVVKFASKGETVTPLTKGTSDNIKRIKKDITAIEPRGSTGSGTVFKNAFIEAFQVLLQAEDEKQDGCKSIIVFFTDGINSDGSGYTMYIDYFQSRLRKHAHIFTYTMSSGADINEPMKIACANQGVWTHINDGDDPALILSNYYRFAEEVKQTARWSTPYEDSFGHGKVLTASQTVTLDGGVYAVAAIDIELKALWKIAEVSDADQEGLLNWLQAELSQTGVECADVNERRQSCRLQILRNRSHPDSVCDAPPALDDCSFLDNIRDLLMQDAQCRLSQNEIGELFCGSNFNPIRLLPDGR